MRLAILVLCAAGLAAPAPAQDAANGYRTYPISFFAVFSPANALEVARRVPGFTLDVGSQDIRGFGQAAGNVVINGARTSSKSEALDAILARIPSNRIVNVEVAPGDRFGSEFAGKAQVLNIILKSSSGLAGTVTATLRRDFSGQVTPEPSVSALYRTGSSTFSASVGRNSVHAPEEGSDTLVSLPSNGLVEFRRKYNDVADRSSFIRGSWESDRGSNRTAHLNFNLNRDRFDLRQRSTVSRPSELARSVRLFQDFTVANWEVGGDVTRPFMGGGLKIVGLATQKRQDRAEGSETRNSAQFIGGIDQHIESRSSERILRVAWNRPEMLGWSWEAGVEAALNRLNSDVALHVTDADMNNRRIDLPVDQARIAERRGEMFVEARHDLSSQLRVVLGATLEHSKLSVRGDATADSNTTFLKPKVAFDWRGPQSLHVQASLARTVRQLNFQDFVGSAEISAGRLNGGNAELVPQRAWQLRLSVDRPVLTSGHAELELGLDRISMLQDRIPVADGLDAPGNFDRGTAAFARAKISIPTDKLGIPGGQVNLKGELAKSSVTDPYTHTKRRFTNAPSWGFEANFRQDLGRFAWGANLEGNPSVTIFHRNETETIRFGKPLLSAFVEYRPTGRSSVNLSLENLLQSRFLRERSFFEPDRSTLTPMTYEYRERSQHIRAVLMYKHNFG